MDCPNCKLLLDVVKDGEERRFLMKARCKSWGCPVCGKVNSRNLARLLSEVVDAYLQANDVTGPQGRYSVKMVTLTCPGGAWRESRTPEQRRNEFDKALTSFLEYLRRHWDVEEYFRVIEDQSDGTPHAHLLILGKCISSKGIMRAINDAWECRGMGRAETKLVRSLKGACYYLVKYLTKPSQKTGGLKGKRCWSMSHKLRDRVKEKKDIYAIEFTVVAVYKLNGDGSCGRMIWEKGGISTLPTALRANGFEEHISLFEGREVKPGVQVYIWSDP